MGIYDEIPSVLICVYMSSVFVVFFVGVLAEQVQKDRAEGEPVRKPHSCHLPGV